MSHEGHTQCLSNMPSWVWLILNSRICIRLDRNLVQPLWVFCNYIPIPCSMSQARHYSDWQAFCAERESGHWVCSSLVAKEDCYRLSNDGQTCPEKIADISQARSFLLWWKWVLLFLFSWDKIRFERVQRLWVLGLYYLCAYDPSNLQQTTYTVQCIKTFCRKRSNLQYCKIHYLRFSPVDFVTSTLGITAMATMFSKKCSVHATREKNLFRINISGHWKKKFGKTTLSSFYSPCFFLEKECTC